MKFKFKRLLALLMAIMLAIPSFAFAEDAELVLDVDTGSDVVAEDLDLDIEVDDPGELAQEEPTLELGGELQNGDLLEGEAAIEAPAQAFEQTLEYDGLRFTVKADAGIVGEGAVLSVTGLNYADEVAEAAKAIGVDGIHKAYGIYLTGAPYEAGKPVVRVEGAAGVVSVVSYGFDKAANAVEAKIDGEAVEFALADVQAYDLVFAAPAEEAVSTIEEAAPAAEEEEVVIEEAPAGEAAPADDGIVLEETSEEASEEEEEIVIEEAPAEEAAPADEGIVLGEEEEKAPAEEIVIDEVPADEAAAEETPVEENAEEVFVIGNYPAFTKSAKVEGTNVRVNVTAPEGAFPEGAKLSVTEVVAEEDLAQVDAAVEAERGDMANIAKSYTLDIKVLDAEGNELQPANGQVVTVTFVADEVSDAELTTEVYHVSDDGQAEALDVSEKGRRATVETEGFSVYYIAFTQGGTEYIYPDPISLNVTSFPVKQMLWGIDNTHSGENLIEGDEDLFQLVDGENIVGFSWNGTDWMLMPKKVGTATFNIKVKYATSGYVTYNNVVIKVYEPSVAKVDSTEYTTLQAAAQAANGTKVITLLDNISEPYSMTANETLLLNKNGKTVTVNYGGAGDYAITETIEGSVTTYKAVPAEASVDGTNYATLAEAVTAATAGQTIDLLKDIDEAYSITSPDQTLKLRKNAHSVTVNYGGTGYYVITEEKDDSGVTTYKAAKILAYVNDTPYTDFEEALNDYFNDYTEGDTLKVLNTNGVQIEVTGETLKVARERVAEILTTAVQKQNLTAIDFRVDYVPYEGKPNSYNVDLYAVITVGGSEEKFKIDGKDIDKTATFTFKLPVPEAFKDEEVVVVKHHRADETIYPYKGLKVSRSGNVELKDVPGFSEFEFDRAQRFNVTFKANGGEGADYTQEFIEDVEQALTPNTFYKTDSVFLGWAESTAPDTVKYTDGQSIKVVADTTLSAVWGAITIALTQPVPSYTFDGNEKRPAVSVTYNDGTADKALPSDYIVDVKYTKNINAGDAKATVTVTNNGNPVSNEELPFTIARKTLTLTALDKSVVEGTDPTAVKYSYDVEGLIANDPLNTGDGFMTSGYVATAKAGDTFDITFTSTEEDLTALSTNYTYVLKQPAKLTVVKATDTVVNIEATPTEFTYSGDPQAPTITVKKTTATGEETVPNTEYTVYYSGMSVNYPTKTDMPTNVGKYQAKVQMKSSSYHINSADTFTFEIKPAVVTVTPDAATKTYGEDDPAAFTYTIDTDGVTLTGALSREAGEDVGDYAFTLGDLSAGDNYELKLADNAPKFTITVATLTFEANDAEMTYGDTALPTFTTEVTGLVNGDTVSDADWTYTPSDVSEVTAVGTVEIVPSLTSDAFTRLSKNYAIGTVTNGTLTVNAAALTVTMDDASKKYGEDDPDSFTYKVKNAAGEEISLPTGVEIETSRATGDDVGTYAITATASVDPANYTVTVVPGTFTIEKAKVLVTVASDDKVYGEDDPTYEVTVTGVDPTQTDLVAADFLAYREDLLTNNNVGVHDLSVSFVSTDKKADNYEFDYTIGTLTITPAIATINPTIGQKKVYGDPDPAVLKYTVSPAAAKDSISGVLTRKAGEDVGYYDYDISSLTAIGNYTLAMTTGSRKFQIVKKPVTVKAENYTITYGDSLADGVLTGTVTGTVGNDSIDVTYALDPAFPYPATGAGYYPIVPTVTGDYPNYNITTKNGILTVDRADLNIEAPSMTINVGEALPDFENMDAKIEGLKNSSEVIKYSLSCNATDSVTPGVYAITVEPEVPSDDNDNGNYEIHTVTGLLIIQDSDAAYTVEFETAPNETYNGNEHKPTVVVKYNDKTLVEDTDYTLDYTDNVNAGTATVTVSPVATSTYTSFKEHVLQFVIKPADLTVTANAQDKVYGDDTTNFDPTDYTTVPDDVTLEGELTREPGEDAGTYAIQQGTLKNDNYNITFTGANFTIAKATLTVKPTASTKVYGAADPVLTYEAEGEVEDDGLTYQVTRDAGENVDSYNMYVTVSGSKLKNYNVTTETGTFTITKATLTFKANDAEMTYGDTKLPTFTTEVAGLVNGDVVNPSDLFYSPDDVADAVNGMKIHPNLTQEAYDRLEVNYAIGTVTDGTLTVNKAELIVIADDQAIMVGQDTPDLTVSVIGLKGTDEAETVLGGLRLKVDTDEDEPLPAGTYAIVEDTTTPFEPVNYTYTFVPGTLTVSVKPIALVKAVGDEFIYSAVAQAPAITVETGNGTLDEDDFTVSYAGTKANNETYGPSADKPVDAGSYTATVALADSIEDYYWLGGQTVIPFEIKQKPVTATWTYDEKTYDGKPVDVLVLPKASAADPYSQGDALKFTYKYDPETVLNAGEYTATAILDDLAYNYVLTEETETYTFRVKPASLTVTVDEEQSKVYGSPNPVLTYTVVGLVNGEKVEDVMSGALTRVAGEGVDSYSILQGSLSAGTNYTIKFVGTTFKIDKKDVTVTAIDKTITYGDDFTPATDLKCAVEGLIGNDEPTITYEVKAGNNDYEGKAGTYTITPVAAFDNSEVAANYNTIYVVPGTLTVKKAMLTIKADDQSILVGEDTPAAADLTKTVLSGLQGSDTDTVAAGITLKIDTNLNGKLPAGNYPIVENKGDTPVVLENYDYVVLPGTLYVTAKPAAYASATNTVQTFDSITPPTVKLTNTAGDELPGNYFTVKYSGDEELPEHAGNYIIEVALTDEGAAEYSLVGQSEFDFIINPASLQVTWEGIDNLVYDGQVKTITATYTMPGATEPSNAAVTPAEVKDAGRYTLIASFKVPNTDYVLTDNIRVIDVAKKALEITPTAGQSKVYGSVDPVLTYADPDGLVTGDKITGMLSRVAGEDVVDGGYAITIGSLSAGDNYDITLKDATFAIVAKEVTVTAVNETITYGDAAPEFTSTVVGMIGNDKLDITYTTDPEFTGKPAAGTYTVTPDATVTVGKAANYDINTVDGTLTVKKAMLTIKADDQAILVGEDTPTELTKTVITGLKGNDQPSVADSITLKVKTDKTGKLPAGNYPIVEGDTPVTLDNYDYVVMSGTLYVTAKPAAYASATNTVQTFDSITAPTVKLTNTAGDELPATYFAVTYSGIVADGSEYTEQTNVPKHVGKYIIKVALTDEGAAEYSLVGQSEFDFIISPASLRVTWGGIDNLVYDGQVKNITATYEMPGATEPSNAAVTPAEVKDAGRYTLIASFRATNVYDYELTDNIRIIDVAKADLTITPTEGQSKVYGSVDPVLTYDTPVLLGANDAITGMLSREAGEDVTDEGYAITIGSLSAGNNYNITVADATFAIVAKNVTVTANDKTITYGEEYAPATQSTSTVDGLIGNDEVEITSYTVDPNYSGNVGTYTVTPDATVTVGKAANYNINTVDGTLTVNKASAMIIANDVEITYGDSLTNKFTATIVGAVKDGDIEYALQSVFEDPEVGEYPINMQATKGTEKYDIKLVPGVLTVVKRPMNVKWTGNVVYPYTGFPVNPLPSVDAAADQFGDVTFLDADDQDVQSDNLIEVGTYKAVYTIDSSLASEANYDVRNSEFIFQIERNTNGVLIDTWGTTGTDWTEDETTEYTGSYIQPIPVLKDAVTGNVIPAANNYTVSYKNNKNAGTATITIKGVQGSLYVIPEMSHTFEITKAQLKVQPNGVVFTNDEKDYDGTTDGSMLIANAQVILTDVKPVDEGKVTVKVIDAKYEDENVNGGAEQKITVTLGELEGDAAANYELPEKNMLASVTGKINPVTLTITAPNASYVYGEAIPETFSDFTVEGLVPGDVMSGVVSKPAAGAKNVDTYAITVQDGYTIMNGTKDHTANYTVTTKPGTLTITKADVEIHVNDVEITYGDEITEAMMTATELYKVDGDELKYTVGADLIGKKLDVKEYPIEVVPDAANATNKNYNIHVVPGVLTVRKKIVHVKVTMITLKGVYTPEGSIAPIIAYDYDPEPTADYGAPIALDTVFYGTVVGKQDIAVDADVYTVVTTINESASPKYNPDNVEYVFSSPTYTVTPREIYVTVKNAEKFETHADPIFTIEIDDDDFLTEKDNVKATVKESIQNSVTFRREPGEEAGKTYAIHLAGANTGNRNYVVKEKAAGTLTIKALPTDFSVAWDGEPYSTTYNGEKQVPGKDNFTVKVEGQETDDFEIVEEPGDDYINAGKHAVYIHSNVEGWNWDGIPMYFEILPRELNVSSISLEKNQKDYDGNADATDLLSKVEITYNAGDIVQGDKVGAVIKSASFDNENVGNDKDITAYFSDELTGEDADNYKLVKTEFIVNRYGVINAIPLTVTANDQTFVYGETIPATFEGYTIEGLVATDKETVSLTRVGSKTDVGVYPEDINVEVTSIVDKDDATKDHIGNYTITPNKGALTITKAPAKIFAHDLEVTYGTAITDEMLTATVIGEVKPGEIVFELNGVFEKSPDLTDAGEYVIDIEPGADCAKNYDFELVPGKLTVIKKPVDVEWTGNLVYAYTGSAIENDKLPKVADADIAKLGTVSFTDAAGAAVSEVKNVGTYKAVFTPTDTKNYDFRNTVFTFAVDRKALIIDVDWKIPASTKYDGKPFNETKGIVPVLTDADTQEVIDPSEYKVIYGENLNAGKATITIINEEGGVYSIPEMVKEFEITKREMVITARPDQYKYYGQPDEEFEWERTGGDTFAEGEGKEDIEGKLGREPSGENAKVPGTDMDVTYRYSVEQMNLLTTNYKFSLAREETFKILPATLKITPSDVSYVYGDAEAEADFKQKLEDGTLAVTYDETFYGDKPSGLVVVKEKADEYNAGTYELSVDTTNLVIKNAKGTDISGNYNFDDSSTGTLTITPDVIVDVDWQEGDYYYDGNAKQPEVVAMTTATGRVVADTDYTVTYSENPVEPGNYVATATLTTEAAKNYVYNPADFTLNFSIFAAGTAVEVTWPTDREDDYDGTVHEFAPTAVKFGNTPLVKDTDYTVIISGELKNAGEYTATVELTEQALKRYNYVMNASTTYTINPVEVTVYTKDATKYVSTADPRLEINVDTIDTSNVPDAEKQAVVDAIKETAVLTRQVGEDIGTYDIYLAYANAGDNYKVVAGNGGKLTIKELPGDCKVEWAQSEPDFVYDGNVHIPTKSDFKVTMEGEEIPFSLVYDDKDSTDAGKYKVWVFSTASGFNWDQPMIYEIKKAPVSAVLDSNVENANLKRYDGNDDAYDIVKDYMIFNGIVSGEDVEVEFDARFDDKNVGDRKVITVTLGDLTGEDARNYYVNQIDELKVNKSQITEATLVITANPQTKVYDNDDTTDPELTYVITLDGNKVEALYGDDEITGSLDREGDQNVGEYAIIQNDLAVDDDNGGKNYTLTFETANFTITKRPVTVTGIRAVDKVYNGSAEAEMNTTDVTFNGLVARDVLTLTVTGLFDDKNVGTHKTVAITYGADALGGGSKGNYELLADDSQSNAYANITPRQVEVSGIVVADKDYDGTTTVDADTQISGTAIGNMVDTDDLTANVTGVYENKYAGTGKTVILDIILEGNDAGNYVLAATTQKTATSAINTIPLTVTGITAQDKPYDGGIDAKLNVDGAGLDGKLGNDVVTLNVDNAKGIFDGKDAGDHTVTVSGLWLDGVDARNYTLSECTAPAKINKKTLNVVNLHAEDRVYDSTTDAVITAALEGVVSGEDVSIKADTLKGAFNSAHVAEADHVYITNIELDGEADVLANYQLDDTQWSALTADANITKFVIDVANVPIQVANKDYDAKTTADMQEAKITTGTVYVDSHYEELRATGTATFMTKDAGLNKDVLITHLTLLDGEDNNTKGLASDYDLTTRTTTATANINKYQIHISGVKAEDKQYDGTAVAELDVSEAEFVTPPLSIEVVTDEGTITVTDEVTIESGTGTFDGEDVKPKRNVTNPIIVLGGADGHNYEPIVDDSLKADITPCLVKIEGFAAQSKDYDGSEHADLVDYEITDLLLVAVLEDRQAVLDGDIADYSLALDDSEIDANFDNEDVGTDKPVTITGLKLTSNPASIASNYEIVPPVVYANINQLDAQIIEVQGEPAVIDKVYDGNNIAYLDVDKLVLVLPAGQYAQDDDVHIASDGYIARYADVNADDGEGEGIDVTIANLRLTGDDAYKYKLDDTDVYVVKGHILKKEVKIVGVAVADKVYNGKADDATSYVKLRDAKVVGTIGNDVVNVANTKSAIYDNPNAGTNKMVTVTDLSLAGEADVLKNYKLPQDYSLRLTGVITPKTVIANGIEVTAKDYDGKTDATLGEATINGKVDGDDLSVTATGKFSDKNADEDKLVTLELTLAGAAKDNYVLSNQSQTTARGTINPVAVNISGITAENKIYDGNDNATLNWSSATFETKKLATDELFVANAKGKFSDANADDGKTVTINATDVVLAGKDANNYKVGTVATATADITKATVYVFPEDATIAYLDLDPVFKYHVSGLKANEPLSVISGELSRESGDDVGIYAISTDGLVANNYDIVKGNNAALTIISRRVQPKITVTTPVDQIVYNGKEWKPAVEVEDDLGNVIPSNEYEPVYSNNFDAGTATVTVKDINGGNYDIHVDSVNFTIRKAPLTVKPNKVYWTWSYKWVEPNWDNPEASWWTATPGVVDPTNEKIAVQLQRNSKVTNVKDTPVKNDVSVKKVTITRNGRDITANYDINATAKADFEILPLRVIPTIQLTGMDYGNDPAWKVGKDRGFDYTGKELKPVVTLLDADGNVIPYSTGKDSEYKWEVKTIFDNKPIEPRDSNSFKIVITDDNKKGNYDIDTTKVIDADHSQYKIYPKLVTLRWDPDTLVLGYNGFQQTPTAIVNEFPDVKVSVKVIGGDGINVKNNPHTAEAWGFEEDQPNLKFPKNHPVTQYTITKATLTIKPNASKLTKVYGTKDGDMPYTYTGLKGDDAQKVKVVGKLHRANGEHAGNYAIDTSLIDVVSQFDGAPTGNYNIVLDKPYNFVITRRPLEVAWSNGDIEMSAEGWALDANYALYRLFENRQMKPDNLVIVDKTIDSSVVSQKVDLNEYDFDWSDMYSFDAGTYTFKVVDRAGGDFDITCPRSMKYRIDPVTVSLTWKDHMVYNGKEQKPEVTVTVNEGSFSKVKLIADVQVVTQPSQDVNLPTGASEADAKPKYKAFVKQLLDNGSDPKMDQNTIDNNFKFDRTEHEFYITPAGLTVTADNLTKIYRDPDPQLTYTVTGLLGEDTAETVVTGALVREPGEDVGVYGILNGYTDENGTWIQTLSANKNYDMTFVPGTLTILEKPVTVVNANVQILDVPRTYNGKDHTPEVIVTVDDVVIPSNEYTVTYENNHDAGTASIYLADVPGGNYNLAFDMKPTLTFDIRPRTVTLKWGTLEFQYDGKRHVPTCKVGGLIEGDVCRASVSYSDKPVNAGTYTAFAVDLSNKNYKLPKINSTKFVIKPIKEKIPVDGVVLSKTTYTYNGKAKTPIVTVYADGVVIPKSEYKVTYKNNIHAGTAQVIIRNVPGNYDLDFESKTYDFTILQRTAQLVWSNLNFVYDGKAHKPTATVGNLVKGDTCKVTVRVIEELVSNAKYITAKEIGGYVAQAIKLSNKDYKLPEETTTEFYIAPRKVSGNLILTMKRRTNLDSLKLKWTKVKGVDGYDIFMSRCTNEYTHYLPELVQTIDNNSTFTWYANELKPGICYKALVKAFILVDGKKEYVRTSLKAHCVTYGPSMYTNSTELKVNKEKVTLKKGKTFQIKATTVKEAPSKKYVPHEAEVRYFSTDTNVATVSSDGKITAVGAGFCRIYVETLNGIYKAVKVTVK